MLLLVSVTWLVSTTLSFQPWKNDQKSRFSPKINNINHNKKFSKFWTPNFVCHHTKPVCPSLSNNGFKFESDQAKKRKLFDEFCEMTSLPCSIRNDIFLPSLPPRRWNISESLVRLKLGNIFVWKSWNDIDRDDVFPEKTNQLRKTNICFGLSYLFIRLFVRGFLSFSFYLRSVNKVSFHMLITSSQTEHSAWQRWSVFKKRNTVAFLNFAVLLLSMF